MINQIYKKYGNFRNQKRTLLTIDWLQVNIKDLFSTIQYDQNNLFEKDNFVFELTPHLTQNFKKLVYIYYEGIKVLELSYENRHPIILKGRAMIKFENELFYSNEYHEIWQKFNNSFKCIDPKITKIDLAVDGVNFHKFINNHLKVKNYTQKQLKYEGIKKDCKRVNDIDNITPVYTTTRDSYRNKYDSFTIGDRGARGKTRKDDRKRSTRYVRYYNKSAELLTHKGKKDYISTYFKENGLNNKKDIYRFEISIQSKFIKQLDGFTFNDIFKKDKLISLFRTSLKNFFEFRLNQRKKINECKPLELFTKLEQASIYQRVKRVVKDAIRTIKVGIKRDVLDTLRGLYDYTHKGLIRSTVIDKIKVFDLSEWWLNTYPKICNEYFVECKKNNIEYDRGTEILLGKWY